MVGETHLEQQNNLFWQHGECERSPCDDFIISANSWRFGRCCFTNWRKAQICWKKAGAVQAVGGEQKSAGNASCPTPPSFFGSEIWAIFSKTPTSLSPCPCALRTLTDFYLWELHVSILSWWFHIAASPIVTNACSTSMFPGFLTNTWTTQSLINSSVIKPQSSTDKHLTKYLGAVFAAWFGRCSCWHEWSS